MLPRTAGVLVRCSVTLLATALILATPVRSVVLAAPGEAKLVPADTTLTDALGSAVAMSGDTALLGAPWDGDLGKRSGSAYVFERDGQSGDWLPATKLTASNGSSEDLFGTAVAIDGDTMVVGAPGDSARGRQAGSAYVFEREPDGDWVEVRRLNAGDAASGDAFGTSVAISGDTIVVGAPRVDRSTSDAGAAYVFARDLGAPGRWGQAARLVSSDGGSNELFGWSAAVDGDRAAIGAPGDSGSGRAFVFARGATGGWSQVRRIAVPGTQPLDDFGWSVAMEHGVLIVGARRGTQDGIRSGWAGVFEQNLGGADKWRQVSQLVASDAAAWDLFGSSIALAGNLLLVGAPANGDAGARSGSVYLFQRSGSDAGAFSEIRKLTASDARAQDHLGSSVALAGGVALVGAPGPPAGTIGVPIGGWGAGGAYLFAAGNGAVCSAAPATGCVASWQAGLLRVNQKVPGRERMVVRLRGEPGLAQADFGNPLTVGGTNYVLCVYDGSGGLIGEVKVGAAGSACGDAPCWRPLAALPPDGTGFEYRGQTQQLRLHAGKGRSELLYEATGAVPSRLAERLGPNATATLQLVADGGPACFALTMSRVKAGTGFFKAKK
jgi:hypothetical protein